MKKFKLMIAIVVMGFFSACSSTTSSSGGSEHQGAIATPVENTPVQSEKKIEPRVAVATNENMATPLEHIVYFDFDKSIIRPEASVILAAQAKSLIKSHARVLLEGHCDERGTRTYNQALGERRAKAVEKFLMMEGVNADQLSMISYGKDRPADPHHNEAAWAKNRRVEIK